MYSRTLYSSADKELRFARRKRPSDYGIASHSTIGVIFRLPDEAPAPAPAAVTPVVTVRRPHKTRDQDTAGKVEKDEIRPELRRLSGYVELTNAHADFLDDELNPDLFRAIMPCGHVIGNVSELRRQLFISLFTHLHVFINVFVTLFILMFINLLIHLLIDEFINLYSFICSLTYSFTCSFS